MPDQDTEKARAGSPPCDCCGPDACPCGYCFYPAFVQPDVGHKVQMIDGRTGEVTAEGVTYHDPVTGEIKVDLEPPADTPAVVEGP